MSFPSAACVHRLAARLTGQHAVSQAPLQLRCLTSLHCWGVWHRAVSAAPGHAAAAWAPPPPVSLRGGPARRPAPAASYTVVTGQPSSGGDAGGTPFKLIVYSKEGCHLCDGLKEKLQAVVERAAFLPSALSGVEIEVRDIASRPEWEEAYGLQIPVLATAAPDGSSEAEVPRPSPRLSADALQRHIEKFLAARQAGQ